MAPLFLPTGSSNSTPTQYFRLLYRALGSFPMNRNDFYVLLVCLWRGNDRRHSFWCEFFTLSQLFAVVNTVGSNWPNSVFPLPLRTESVLFCVIFFGKLKPAFCLRSLRPSSRRISSDIRNMYTTVRGYIKVQHSGGLVKFFRAFLTIRKDLTSFEVDVGYEEVFDPRVEYRYSLGVVWGTQGPTGVKSAGRR